MFILSLLIFTSLLITVALIDYQSFHMFVDIQSIVYITSLSVLFTLISVPPNKIISAFKTLIKKDINTNHESYLILKQAFTALGSSALIIGIFLTVTFWVSLAQQAHQIVAPGASLSLSFSLIFTSYGLLIKIVSFLITQRISYELSKAAISDNS